MLDYTVRPPAARAKGKRKNAFQRFLISIFPYKGDSGAEVIRKIVFIGAVVAFVITGGSVVRSLADEAYHIYYVDGQIKNDKNSSSGNLSIEEVNDIKEDKPYIREELMSLYAKNNDLIGWITVGGGDMVIDYPVVQSEDNDYYLTTDFYGNTSEAGSIFADSRCEISENGDMPNFLVLYGHNTHASNMFSKLTRYYYYKEYSVESEKMTAFYKQYPTLTFDTLAKEGTYKIFAVCLFNTEEEYGEVYNYLRRGASFTDKDEFNNYIIDIMDRSSIFTDVDITYGDEILCMSTCYFLYGSQYDNLRCAVFARRVRDGESAEVDVSKAEVNYYRVLFQQEIDRGVGSGGVKGVWNKEKYLLSYDG